MIVVTTHQTVDRANTKAQPEKLSMGIMESLSMADPSLSSFNDSERRQKSKAGVRNRELQVLACDFPNRRAISAF